MAADDLGLMPATYRRSTYLPPPGAASAAGPFTAAITGLSADTTYYLRPYAIGSYVSGSNYVNYLTGLGPTVTVHTASDSAAGSSPAANGIVTAALTGTGVISADSIVIDPTASSTLYAGMNGAGVYKSTNSGATWTAATTQPADTRIKAMVIKKSDTKILYAGTYGGGVYKSGDSGGTWTACASNPGNLNIMSLSIDDGGTIYAGTEDGIYKSTDACASWTGLDSGLP